LAAVGCNSAAPQTAQPTSYDLHAAGARSEALVVPREGDDEPDPPDEPPTDYPDWPTPDYPSWPPTEDPNVPPIDDPNVPPIDDPNVPPIDDPNAPPIDDPIRTVADASGVLNNWGCDTDIPGILDMSSSEWGACCDDHDTCYEVNNCTADSWGDAAGTPCQICNDTVAACMDTKPGPGPSVCTIAANNTPCGSYRSGPH
jgi:hypothetical protein